AMTAAGSSAGRTSALPIVSGSSTRQPDVFQLPSACRHAVPVTFSGLPSTVATTEKSRHGLPPLSYVLVGVSVYWLPVSGLRHVVCWPVCELSSACAALSLSASSMRRPMWPPMSMPATVPTTIAVVRPVPPPIVEPTTAPATVPFCSLVGGFSQPIATSVIAAISAAAFLPLDFTGRPPSKKKGRDPRSRPRARIRAGDGGPRRHGSIPGSYFAIT